MKKIFLISSFFICASNLAFADNPAHVWIATCSINGEFYAQELDLYTNSELTNATLRIGPSQALASDGMVILDLTLSTEKNDKGVLTQLSTSFTVPKDDGGSSETGDRVDLTVTRDPLGRRGKIGYRAEGDKKTTFLDGRVSSVKFPCSIR